MPSIKGTLGGLGAVGLGAAGMVGRGLGMGNVMAAGLAGGALFKGGYDKASAKKDDDDDDAKIEARAAWVASDKILQSIYKDIVEIKNHLQKGIIPESQAKEIAIQENARFDEVLKVLQSEGLFMGPEAEEGEKPSSFLDKIKSFFNFAKFGGFFAKFLGIMKLGRLWSIMGIAVRLLARFFWPVLLGGFIIAAVWTNWDKISQVWKDTMTAIKDTVFGWMDKIKETWDKVVDAWDWVKTQWTEVLDQWEKVQSFLEESLTTLFSPNEGEDEVDVGMEDETMTDDSHSFVGQDGLPVTFTAEELELQGLKVDEDGRLVSIDDDDTDSMEGKDWMINADGELIILVPLAPEDEKIAVPDEVKFDESMIPTDVARRATKGAPDESWKDLDYIMSLIQDEQGPRVDQQELKDYFTDGEGLDDEGVAAAYGWKTGVAAYDVDDPNYRGYGKAAIAVDKFIDVGDVTPASLTDDTVTDEEKEEEIASVIAGVEAGVPALVASVLDKDVPGAETQQEKVQPEDMVPGRTPKSEQEVLPVIPQDGVMGDNAAGLGGRTGPGEGGDEASAITPSSATTKSNSTKKDAAASAGAGTTSGGGGQSDSSAIVPSTSSSPSTFGASAQPTPSVALVDDTIIIQKTTEHNIANTQVSAQSASYHKRHGVMNPHAVT